MWVVVGASLAAAELKHGFSECDNGKRNAYFYTDKPLTCGGQSPDLGMIRGLDCELSCPSGYFLGLDTARKESVCEKCPSGTYSVGGGTLYSGKTLVWQNPWPLELHTDCEVLGHDYKWHKNVDCNAWTPRLNGTIISSGDNKFKGKNFTLGTPPKRLYSTLYLNVNFVRDGNVTFRYRVDAEQDYDGMEFMVDFDLETEFTSQKLDWTEATAPVSRGSHTLKWQFSKDNTGDNGMDRAEIEIVELIGTKFADEVCLPCSTEGMMGSETEQVSRCLQCPKNHYADDRSLKYVCRACPFSHYSAEGSVSLASCKPKLPCTEEDTFDVVTPCGRVGSEYRMFLVKKWKHPKICNSTLPGAVSLDQFPRQNMTCPACPPGHFRPSGRLFDGSCKSCPPGHVAKATKDLPKGPLTETNACMKCPTAQFTLKSKVIGEGGVWWDEAEKQKQISAAPSAAKAGAAEDDDAEVFDTWPAEVDAPAAERNEWENLGSFIVSPPFGRWEDEPEDADNLLKMNVELVHDGFISFEYEVVHSKWEDDNGASAWLFFAVDGKLTFLKEGNVPGRHHERVQVVSGKHMVQWWWRRRGIPVGDYAYVKIHTVTLGGIAGGGADSCQTCPPGSQTLPDQSGCRKCPAGSFINLQLQSCVACPADHFSEAGSSECTKCGNNTFAPQRSSHCSVQPSLTFVDLGVWGGRTRGARNTAAAGVVAVPEALAAELPSTKLPTTSLQQLLSASSPDFVQRVVEGADEGSRSSKQYEAILEEHRSRVEAEKKGQAKPDLVEKMTGDKVDLHELEKGVAVVGEKAIDAVEHDEKAVQTVLQDIFSDKAEAAHREAAKAEDVPIVFTYNLTALKSLAPAGWMVPVHKTLQEWQVHSNTPGARAGAGAGAGAEAGHGEGGAGAAPAFGASASSEAAGSDAGGLLAPGEASFYLGLFSPGVPALPNGDTPTAPPLTHDSFAVRVFRTNTSASAPAGVHNFEIHTTLERVGEVVCESPPEYGAQELGQHLTLNPLSPAHAGLSLVYTDSAHGTPTPTASVRLLCDLDIHDRDGRGEPVFVGYGPADAVFSALPDADAMKEGLAMRRCGYHSADEWHCYVDRNPDLKKAWASLDKAATLKKAREHFVEKVMTGKEKRKCSCPGARELTSGDYTPLERAIFKAYGAHGNGANGADTDVTEAHEAVVGMLGDIGGRVGVGPGIRGAVRVRDDRQAISSSDSSKSSSSSSSSSGSSGSSTYSRRMQTAAQPAQQTQPAPSGPAPTFNFEWRTRFACPVCLPHFYKVVKSECSHGRQRVRYYQILPCVGGQEKYAVHEMQDCEAVEMKQEYIVYGLVGASLVGIFVVILVIYAICVHIEYTKARREYMRLASSMQVETESTTDGQQTTFNFAADDNSMDAYGDEEEETIEPQFEIGNDSD